ncbi:hypothetical protein MRX96_055981 [Rhipicephalus microplus]
MAAQAAAVSARRVRDPGLRHRLGAAHAFGVDVRSPRQLDGISISPGGDASPFPRHHGLSSCRCHVPGIPRRFANARLCGTGGIDEDADRYVTARSLLWDCARPGLE